MREGENIPGRCDRAKQFGWTKYVALCIYRYQGGEVKKMYLAKELISEKKNPRAVGDKRTVSKVLWKINHKHHLEAADLIHSIPITINLTGI